MSTLFIDQCEVIATMDDAGTEVAGGSILVEDGVITWVGIGNPPDTRALDGATRIDGRGTVALPGLINTHHHLFQTLTRVHAQDKGLFGWLKTLYPVWAGIDEEWVHTAARVGLAELALSGCTTTTDHHYVFPRGRPGMLEAEIAAARQIGLRFHPCRGSMDLGESQGGLPPDDIVEDTDAILASTEEAIRKFHDPRAGSMLRIAVAPCSPFSATSRLMRESAMLARRMDVRLHTHIAETLDEEVYCRTTFGKRPVQLLEDLGWLGPDVWLAHCVHIDTDDIGSLATHSSGVAWCPTSNLRLGSGIAPIRDLLDARVHVGLGVDGSASNDSGHMLSEARVGMLAARARRPDELNAREALRIATRGGAACLGRADIGVIEPGKRADIALFGIDGLEFAGSESDPLAAIVFCAPQRVRQLFVEGRQVVRDRRLVTADEDEIAAAGHRMGGRIWAATPWSAVR